MTRSRVYALTDRLARSQRTIFAPFRGRPRASSASEANIDGYPITHSRSRVGRSLTPSSDFEEL
jgi:hypothetical protein